MPSPQEIQEDILKTAEYAAKQDAEKNREATQFAHKILDEILAFLRPGVKESEVKAYGLSRFEAHNVERPWHSPYIRFSEHTLMTYYNKAKEDRVLGETDIAFADIGVVRNGIEGDAGRTVVFGKNEVFTGLRDASEKIFYDTLEYWKQKDPTGEELHAHADALTKKAGFVFNLDPASHLIGTFPHRGWKHGLNHFPGKIVKGVWILEIQIRHPELPYGAFFEDILL